MPMPLLSEDPLAWFDFLASSSTGTASRTTLLRAISAILPVDADKLGTAIEQGLLQGVVVNSDLSAAEFLADGLYAWIRRHEQEHIRLNCRGAPPNIVDRTDWFRYWDFSQSGLISRGEVLRAMLKTFEVSSFDRRRVEDLRRRVDKVWDRCSADRRYKQGHCTAQGVSCPDFLDAGGLGDLLEEALASAPSVEDGELWAQPRDGRGVRPVFTPPALSQSAACNIRIGEVICSDLSDDEDEDDDEEAEEDGDNPGGFSQMRMPSQVQDFNDEDEDEDDDYYETIVSI